MVKGKLSEFTISKRIDMKTRSVLIFTAGIMDGRVVFDDVIKFYYDQTNEMFGTDFEPPK